MRATCPACRSTNDCAPSTRGLGLHTCSACGANFTPREYTTDAAPDPTVKHVGRITDAVAHAPIRSNAERDDVAAVDSWKKRRASEARTRLAHHVEKYTDYIDRDRDILLLHLLDRIDELVLDRAHALVTRGPKAP